MLEEMRCAAFGGKLDSNASQFQASDAFYAATIAGAQGLGAPLGRIEPGFAADLLLVDPTRPRAAQLPPDRASVPRRERGHRRPHGRGPDALPERAGPAQERAAAQAAAQKAWSLAQRRIL